MFPCGLPVLVLCARGLPIVGDASAWIQKEARDMALRRTSLRKWQGSVHRNRSKLAGQLLDLRVSIHCAAPAGCPAALLAEPERKRESFSLEKVIWQQWHYWAGSHTARMHMNEHYKRLALHVAAHRRSGLAGGAAQGRGAEMPLLHSKGSRSAGARG